MLTRIMKFRVSLRINSCVFYYPIIYRGRIIVLSVALISLSGAAHCAIDMCVKGVMERKDSGDGLFSGKDGKKISTNMMTFS